MPDTLKMSFSLTAIELFPMGNSIIHSGMDSVAQRTWGGSMTRDYNAGVDSDKIAVWENVVVSSENAATDNTNGLDASAWTTASAVTRGTIPSYAKVVALEYVSSIGSSPNYVYLYIGQEGDGSEKHSFCKLEPGEGIVIPLDQVVAYATILAGGVDSASNNGIDPALLKVVCTDHDLGSNEVTVNLLLAGR